MGLKAICQRLVLAGSSDHGQALTTFFNTTFLNASRTPMLFDASSKIAHEVAVWVAAPASEQVRERYFHLSVEEREIILSPLANWTLLPQRE